MVSKGELYYYQNGNVMNLKCLEKSAGVSMKLKKKARMMIVLLIVSSLLSGCGFGETKIEYERLVKALDEGI